jgi:hypothetical protein
MRLLAANKQHSSLFFSWVNVTRQSHTLHPPHTTLCDVGWCHSMICPCRDSLQEALDLTEQIRRSTFTGTVTHSPPEMLRGDPNPQVCDAAGQCVYIMKVL